MYAGCILTVQKRGDLHGQKKQLQRAVLCLTVTNYVHRSTVHRHSSGDVVRVKPPHTISSDTQVVCIDMAGISVCQIIRLSDMQ